MWVSPKQCWLIVIMIMWNMPQHTLWEMPSRLITKENICICFLLLSRVQMLYKLHHVRHYWMDMKNLVHSWCRFKILRIYCIVGKLLTHRLHFALWENCSPLIVFYNANCESPNTRCCNLIWLHNQAAYGMARIIPGTNIRHFTSSKSNH